MKRNYEFYEKRLRKRDQLIDLGFLLSAGIAFIVGYFALFWSLSIFDENTAFIVGLIVTGFIYVVSKKLWNRFCERKLEEIMTPATCVYSALKMFERLEPVKEVEMDIGFFGTGSRFERVGNEALAIIDLAKMKVCPRCEVDRVVKTIYEETMHAVLDKIDPLGSMTWHFAIFMALRRDQETYAIISPIVVCNCK